MRRSHVARGAAALIVALVAAMTGALPAVASAADEADGAITWSVRPGDANGADGRSWVEQTLDPGDRVTEHLVIVNHTRHSVEFALSAADGYFTPEGRFNMLPSDRPSTGAGTWIDLPDSVALDGGGTAVVPFTVSVPEDATPGDHPAGVAASILSSDGSLGVESRVGFRVMTRVTGAWHPSVGVHAEGRFDSGLNPFDPGRMSVDYRLENTGNMRVGATVEVTATGLFGAVSTPRTGAPVSEFAPGEERTASLRVAPLWPLFVYTVDIVVTPVGVGDDASADAGEPRRTSLTVVAIPWPQLVVIAIAALLGVLWWRGRRQRRREIETMLDAAREEGRRAASRVDGTA